MRFSPLTGKLGAHKEHSYCQPFAESLADDKAFRTWVLERLGLGDFATSALCLREEQRAQRPSARFWWKDYYCHERRCVCAGLAGRQIDVLAIFRNGTGRTVGLHVECKHPTDRFTNPAQSEGYRRRASCWGPEGRNPPTVLPHAEAFTVLICDRNNSHAESDLKGFDHVLYFDGLREKISGLPET
jgi:hypothetical protein